MTELLAHTAQRATRYLHDIQTRSVAPSAEAVAALDVLNVDLPNEGVSPDRVLEELDSIGSPAT